MNINPLILNIYVTHFELQSTYFKYKFPYFKYKSPFKYKSTYASNICM